MKANFVQRILSEIGVFLFPVSLLVKSEQHRSHFLSDIDIFKEDLNLDYFAHVGESIDGIVSSLETLSREAELESVSDKQDVFVSIIDLIDQITTLVKSIGKADLPNAKDAGEVLLGYFLTLYINNKSSHAFWLLCSIQIIETKGYIFGGHGNFYPAKPIRVFKFDNLKGFIENPFEYLKKVAGISDLEISNYENDEEVFSFSDMFFPMLGRVINSLGGHASYGIPLYAREEGMSEEDVKLRTLRLLWRQNIVGDVDDEFSLSIFLKKKENDKDGVVSLNPLGEINHEETFDQIVLSVSLAGEGNGLKLNENGVQYRDGGAKLAASVKLLKQPNVDLPGPSLLIGLENGTHLKVERIKSNLNLEISENFDFSGELLFEEGAFKIGGSSGDSFINNLLPSEGVNGNFDLGIGFSTDKGFFVKGGMGAKYQSLEEKKLGPFTVSMLEIGITASNEMTEAYGIIAGSAALGPLGISIDGIGARLKVDFDTPGVLGNSDLTVGFRPPTGIGLSLNTPTVKGGGFIKFDNPDYSGIVSLELIEVGTVTAIGLISTELPDKASGYSMLIQIFGEFSPIQIGFGFTLNGVGGLLGVHRTINTDALKATFRSGQLGQLLFPEDPISDAAAIIENLKNIFPVEKDSYVFGFMGKFTWGTPALVDFSVGIMVKLGGPAKIIILGTGITMLPNKAAPLIVLKVDMLGIIDVQEEYLTIEARLFESRISIFDLKGGMALYVSWGAVPDFIMSIGGFHSGYQLTTDRIDLPERIETSLSGDGWKLSMQGFFAITTNSLQTGARADIFAKKGNYTAEAGAGFEAIIIFQPFSFEVDIFFYVTIKKKGKTKASANLDIHLKGPNPYNVQGRLEIKFLGIKFKVKFEATFGDRRLEEQVDIVFPLRIVKKAIEAPEAQEYIPPPWLQHENKQKMGSATSNPENGAIDMGGEVIIRQSAIPLGISLDHVGNAPIPAEQKFLSLKASRIPDAKLIKGKFAAAQFFNLTEDEKLSRPAFEDRDAGIKFSANHHFGEAVTADENFENIYLDLDKPEQYFKGNSRVNALPRFGNLYSELTPASYNLHDNNVGFEVPPGASFLSSGEGETPEFVSATEPYQSPRVSSPIELF